MAHPYPPANGDLAPAGLAEPQPNRQAQDSTPPTLLAGSGPGDLGTGSRASGAAASAGSLGSSICHQSSSPALPAQAIAAASEETGHRPTSLMLLGRCVAPHTVVASHAPWPKPQRRKGASLWQTWTSRSPTVLLQKSCRTLGSPRTGGQWPDNMSNLARQVWTAVCEARQSEEALCAVAFFFLASCWVIPGRFALPRVAGFALPRVAFCGVLLGRVALLGVFFV